MNTIRIFSIIGLLFFISACSSGLNIKKIGQGKDTISPYVDGMNGVENLVFDGNGAMFVTSLDGYIYKVVPTENKFKGKIELVKKVGDMCLGVEIADKDHIFVVVEDEDGDKRIIKFSKDFKTKTAVTKVISGLNGILVEGDYLYYVSSNLNIFWKSGNIYRLKLNATIETKPELVVKDTYISNGLTFSKDKKTLYYTNLFNSLYSYNLKTKKKQKIFDPSGFLHMYDDIETLSDGTILMCFNSEKGIVPFKKGIKPKNILRIGNMAVPSACRIGKGKGFLKDHLYVTEFGPKGRSLDMSGRGVWMVPISEIVN